jgi:hypothetical protein
MTEYRGQKTEVSVTPKAMFFICRYLCYKKIVARRSYYDRRFTNREIRCNSEAVFVFCAADGDGVCQKSIIDY